MPTVATHWDLLMEILSLEVQQPFLICEFTNWPQGWKDASKAKQEDRKCPRSGAVCAHLCLGIQELGGTCSDRGSVERAGQLPEGAADVGCSVWMCVSPPTAIDLLYWRDIKQTGIVFGSFLLLLFSLTQFSVVSVVAYLALAALSATISFRIYKSVLQAVQKTDEGHPFKWVPNPTSPCPTSHVALSSASISPPVHFGSCFFWPLTGLLESPLTLSFNIKYFC